MIAGVRNHEEKIEQDNEEEIMELILKNGDEISINRRNCGFESGHSNNWCNERTTRMWNINPLEILEEKRAGFFVIGEWGTGFGKPADMLIPIDSVLYIRNPYEWEPESRKEKDKWWDDWYKNRPI